ncbi:dihydropteroate synthase [Parasphingopyxis algicola]|uniref:dihydropteroate synthase n=1 Tax=Parasphingopyxis algicola TaxID=2026624 RepID=UPI0015A25AF0|nr:dihydropteroate synthase [Parasphingopyxis algicola]QLC23606.1 dihydropteroate synthase [Parasphingopyxis algicola]
MTDIPPSASLYFRPTGFVEAPFGLDGQVMRLAGGLLWFSAFDVIVVDGGERLAPKLVTIDTLDDFIGSLSDAQAQRARTAIARIGEPRAPFQLGERVLRFDEPRIAGILNVTPDSFSDGGRHSDDPQGAADAGFAMSSRGAAMIDVGGESTRPGAADVWEGDEIERVIPVIERLAASGVAISVDTRKVAVMEAALSAGAAIVNDVSALRFDDRSLALVAAAGCPVIIMHHAGKGHELHADPDYRDPLVEVYDWLENRVEELVKGGVARDKIVIDPGIGFGKALQHNLALINGLSLFHGLGCPIMLGASRKRLIGALSNEAPADERLGGSLALVTLGAAQGVQLLRVHDVAESVQALHVWRGLRDAALIPAG